VRSNPTGARTVLLYNLFIRIVLCRVGLAYADPLNKDSCRERINRFTASENKGSEVNRSVAVM
jgi:hypothetical protein